MARTRQRIPPKHGRFIALRDPIRSYAFLHGRDRDLLIRMKRDVILVNTWRGAVLDEVALIQCLKERKIAGASLDVFAQESLDKNNPLKERDNAILASHNAVLTQECVIRLALEAVQSALAVPEGKRPDGIVNPEVLTHPRWQKFP
jgi:D-3-phosphoglycerate dehydrogenase